MDCDDCYREGFLSRSLPLTESGSDLYIFGIERVPLRGNNEYWTVKDGVYETAGAFADRYIRMRQLLVYSNCNKFYKREVIEREHLRFKENVDFGEDRLFNYAFLTACGRRESSGPCVTTSSMIMLRYIQRNEKSMSSCHKPGYFDCVMRLHQDKMDCFLTLSEDVTEEEKLDFEAYDFSNLPLINRMIFGGPYDMDARVDVLVILGSRNCGYKVERALQIGRVNPEMKYIVSGGNPHKDGLHTEAEYMAEYLRVHGISDKQIYLENRAKYTKQNLLFSYGIIHELEVEADADSMESAPLRIGIITGGFHIRRTKLYADEIDAFAGEEVVYFPAYGPTTHIDTWFNDPVGRGVVLQELRKYRSRLSGPFMERIDLHLSVPRVEYGEGEKGLSSSEMRKLVMRGRRAQEARFAGTGILFNSQIPAAQLDQYCLLDPEADALLRMAGRRLALSMRTYHKTLRIARTIADIDGAARIGTAQMAEALQYRPKDVEESVY